MKEGGRRTKKTTCRGTRATLGYSAGVGVLALLFWISLLFMGFGHFFFSLAFRQRQTRPQRLVHHPGSPRNRRWHHRSKQ